MRFAIGDWVQSRTGNGEFIHGFIDAWDETQGIVKVHVVKSDNEASVGKLAAVPHSWLKQLPPISLDEAAPLLNLIDITLSTRDEAWFAELTERLNALGQSGRQGGSGEAIVPVNRLAARDGHPFAPPRE